MKKKTIADKMAEKFLDSKKFKEHWDIHMQIFGPILEPAFKDDPQSRLHLVNALSNISRGELKDGLQLLDKIADKRTNDDDEAAWLFFMGLVFDMAEIKDSMMQYYMASCEYNHLFYMPYMKVAKNALADRAFDAAEDYFKRAIYCLTQSNFPGDGTMDVMLASAYTQLSSALTSMHRYEEAYDFITLSENTLPSQAGRNATKAILCAAMGRKDESDEALEELKKDSPEFMEDTLKMLNDIYDKKSAGFFDVGTDENEITSFWEWFTENEKDLYGMLTQARYEEFFGILGERMKSVFPFMLESFEFGIEEREDSYKILFADFYAVSLAKGYERLISCAPDELKERWEFDICR